MSETVTEAPMYKQTTFSNVVKDLEQFENTSNQSTQETQTETSETTVNNNGSLENSTTETAQETTTQTETNQVEENVSQFDLGESAQTQNASQQQGQTSEQPSYNWKEEIKKLNKKEVAKELGLNDFTLEMDEYLSKGGNATDYITKRGFDWNKISDEELAKQDLRNLYPDAQPAQIERLYNKKYSQQDLDSDEDKEDGLLLMKADARRIRESKITEQNSFKIPEAIIPQITDEAYLQWKQMQESQPAMMKQLNEFYQNHEVTKSLNESKRVAVNLGDGVPAFNFVVNNPDALTRMYTDGGESWARQTSNEKGEPDVAKQHLISLFAHNPQKFAQDIFNYGMQMGRKKMVDDGQNAQRPQQKPMPQEMNSTTYGTGKFSDKARN